MNPPTGPVLRDIHLPPPPAWWPPAPGWWLLAALGVVVVVVVIVWWRRLLRRRRYRRDVLAEFDRRVEAARGDPAMLAAALSQFLRRVARQRDAAAACYPGERWLEYLDAQADTDEFSRGVGRALIDAPFRRAVEYDTAALVALARRQVRGALDVGATHA